MGFLSYSMNFYRGELERLETRAPDAAAIYRARQLLKMLDDLADEGYLELNEHLEGELRGISRLRAYLARNHAEPFPGGGGIDAGNLPYSDAQVELCAAVDQALVAARTCPGDGDVPFADELRRFCRWIGCEEETAYVFLLRDALLPFARYRVLGRERIHSWLLSRSSFAALTGDAHADDALRACVIRALEEDSPTDFPAFRARVLPDMRRVLGAYPRAERRLRQMLSRIGERRILVVESGCTGTFPLLLMALDERVELRMYTTYPYLADIYAGRVYTRRYEDNRRFETMAAQEALFRFADWRDGHFYVRRCADAAMEARACAELRAMLRDVPERDNFEKTEEEP